MHHFVTEMSAHFSYKMVHCGIWHWCILGCVRLLYICAQIGLCCVLLWLVSVDFTHTLQGDRGNCIIASLSVKPHWRTRLNIDGFVQDCSISIANALEILQSCTKPSIYHTIPPEPMTYITTAKKKHNNTVYISYGTCCISVLFWNQFSSV